MCEIGWDVVPGGFLHLQKHSSLVFIIYFNFFSLVDYCFLVKSQQSRIVSMGPILFYRSTQSRTMFFFMSMLRNVLLYYRIYWKWVNIHYNVVLKIPILKKLYVSSWKISFYFQIHSVLLLRISQCFKCGYWLSRYWKKSESELTSVKLWVQAWEQYQFVCIFDKIRKGNLYVARRSRLTQRFVTVMARRTTRTFSGQGRPFFSKSGHFFWFSKKGRGGLPLLSPPFLLARLMAKVKCYNHVAMSSKIHFTDRDSHTNINV